MILNFQEKRSVKSTSSDKGKHEKDSESSKALEEERKKNMELQKELDLQVRIFYISHFKVGTCRLTFMCMVVKLD